MTCIVGLVHQKVVYMGGDSAATNGNQQVCIASRKVFHHGNVLLGCAGSTRMMQLLQYAFVPPPSPAVLQDKPEAYLTTHFVDAMRACFEKGGLSDEERQEYRAQVLVGFAGRLFLISYSYLVQESLNRYAAIGSGDDVAFGVLYATRGLDMEPQARIMCALEAAAHHIKNVHAPFFLASQGQDEERGEGSTGGFQPLP